MRLPLRVTHEFVELVPADREEGKVYISIAFSTAVHSCLCGCGTKVVTPIKPNRWTLIYDGESISLNPSIGNWSFHCRSHYWIRGSRVFDAGPMPKTAIEYGRARDAMLTDRYHAQTNAPTPIPDQMPDATVVLRKRRFWDRLFRR